MTKNLPTYSQALQNKFFDLKMARVEKELNLIKESYPNYTDGVSIPGQYNIDKWIQSLRDLIHKTHQGLSWKQAFDDSTKSWGEVEKFDFNNWIKYYQSRNHLKYAFAQDSNWYVSPDDDMPGYFIPNALHSHTDKVNTPANTNIHSDFDTAKDATIDELSPSEKKKIADKQKKKIISRLDSIEKLLRSDDGHLLTDSELESLMEAIYALKKKITTLKKKASSDSFYKDLIIREANILISKGMSRAPAFLYVAAEETVDDADQNDADGAPPPATTAAPTQGGSPGLPGAVPAATGPASGGVAESSGIIAPSDNVAPMPTSPVGMKTVDPSGNSSMPNANMPSPAALQSAPKTDKGIEGFVEGFIDSSNSDDDDDDLTVYATDLGSILVSEAQEVPAAETAPAVPAPVAPKPVATESVPAADIEVAEGEPLEKSIPTESSEMFDNQLESLLTKATIGDVVKKLEEIAKVFKTREIPRQLSIVDMMLDKLGLISFFPSLSEATNKALESNNYILSRIENIQAQLTGALSVKEIELTHKDQVESPEVEKVKEQLQQAEELDKERKELRKELSDRALLERTKEEAPAIEVTEEELPPAAPTPAPAPVAAPAPPAPPPTAT